MNEGGSGSIKQGAGVNGDILLLELLFHPAPVRSAAPEGCAPAAFSDADLTCDGDVDLKDFAVLSNFVVR